MKDKIYTKNAKEFNAIYEKELRGCLFWRGIPNGKVEIMIADCGKHTLLGDDIVEKIENLPD